MQQQNERQPERRPAPPVMPLYALINFVSSPVFSAAEKEQEKTRYFTKLAGFSSGGA